MTFESCSPLTIKYYCQCLNLGNLNTFFLSVLLPSALLSKGRPCLLTIPALCRLLMLMFWLVLRGNIHAIPIQFPRIITIGGSNQALSSIPAVGTGDCTGGGGCRGLVQAAISGLDMKPSPSRSGGCQAWPAYNITVSRISHNLDRSGGSGTDLPK